MDPSPEATTSWFSCDSDQEASKRESCVSNLGAVLLRLAGRSQIEKRAHKVLGLPFLSDDTIGSEPEDVETSIPH
jgi:hypothetical protein